MICYIPTKNRVNTKTYQLFQKAGIEVLHFVEPQEVLEYNQAKVPNIIILDLNNQGIVYVRNFMLEYARRHNHEWVIICDDDVTAFGIAIKTKTITQDANIWHEILNKAKLLPFEIYGLGYCQHAWKDRNEYTINRSFVEVCVLLHISAIHWNYREQFAMKEDRDFALQTIKYGNGIVKFTRKWHRCPEVGTNSGGLQSQYQAKKDEECVNKMVKEWYPFIGVKLKGDKKDRKDIDVDIKAFAKYYKRIVK